jgi:hypothetical protein
MLKHLMATIEANLKGLNDLCGTSYAIVLEPQTVQVPKRVRLSSLSFGLSGSDTVADLFEQVEELKESLQKLEGVEADQVILDLSGNDESDYIHANCYHTVMEDRPETPREVFQRIYSDINAIHVPYGQIFVGMPFKGELLGSLNRYLKVQEALK